MEIATNRTANRGAAESSSGLLGSTLTDVCAAKRPAHQLCRPASAPIKAKHGQDGLAAMSPQPPGARGCKARGGFKFGAAFRPIGCKHASKTWHRRALRKKASCLLQIGFGRVGGRRSAGRARWRGSMTMEGKPVLRHGWQRAGGLTLVSDKGGTGHVRQISGFCNIAEQTLAQCSRDYSDSQPWHACHGAINLP